MSLLITIIINWKSPAILIWGKLKLWRTKYKVFWGLKYTQVYKFDGKTAALLPSDILQDGLPDTFTLALWMKHSDNTTLDKHAKEHILCSSDDHSKYLIFCILNVHSIRLCSSFRNRDVLIIVCACICFQLNFHDRCHLLQNRSMLQLLYNIMAIYSIHKMIFELFIHK